MHSRANARRSAAPLTKQQRLVDQPLVLQHEVQRPLACTGAASGHGGLPGHPLQGMSRAQGPCQLASHPGSRLQRGPPKANTHTLRGRTRIHAAAGAQRRSPLKVEGLGPSLLKSLSG